MNICVYGSADVLDEKCMEAAKTLGSFIGKNGAKVISVLPEKPIYITPTEK